MTREQEIQNEAFKQGVDDLFFLRPIRSEISKRARDAAEKILRDPKRSKKAKVAEGTALTQRVRK